MQALLPNVLGPTEPELKDLSGRVAVITGGAYGIGFEIARAFALQHCKVVMVNRKEEHKQEAFDKIMSEAKEKGVTGIQLDWKPCDLGNLKDIKETFTEIANGLERLDFLILNAGINADQFALDADGIDRHWGVNNLGNFYVMNLLYPVVRKTSKLPNAPAPRIIFESSEQHRAAPSNVHFGSLEEINDDTIGPTELYGRTKLGMILYTKGLLEKVIKTNKDNVYVISVHPGAVATDMQNSWERAYPGMLGTMLKGASLAMSRSPEQGAYSAIWAALTPEIIEKNQNGWYFQDVGKEGKESKQASDKWLISAIWNLSERTIKDRMGGEEAMQSWH